MTVVEAWPRDTFTVLPSEPRIEIERELGMAVGEGRQKKREQEQKCEQER